MKSQELPINSCFSDDLTNELANNLSNLGPSGCSRWAPDFSPV